MPVGGNKKRIASLFYSYGSRLDAFEQFFALVAHHLLALLLRFAQQSRAHLLVDVSKNGLLQAHSSPCASSPPIPTLTHLALLRVQHVLARRHHERAQLAVNMRNRLNANLPLILAHVLCESYRNSRCIDKVVQIVAHFRQLLQRHHSAIDGRSRPARLTTLLATWAKMSWPCRSTRFSHWAKKEEDGRERESA